ncbi:MAG: NfeD family protein [Acidimicrobiia bacterium]
MRIGRLFAVTLVAVGVIVGGTSFAQTGQDPIVVIEVDGPMDQRSIDFVTAAIISEDAHAYILKIDSPGVSSGDLVTLYQTVAEAPAPVISWIGPNPAVAYGGAAYLANHADIRTAAPGAVVGYLDPAVQQGDAEPPSTRPGEDTERFSGVEEELASATQTVNSGEPAIYGFVDRLAPALGQLIISLDGERVVRGDQVFELSTARTETVDGVEVLIATRPVKFVKAGLLDRFLRLGARPETAFLFLLFGLAFAVFEFYAAGGGLMAAVASLALILSGYGLATLPIRWSVMAALGLGFALLIWGFVQNRVDWRAVVGTLLLLGAGLMITTTRPQYPPAWLMVVLTVVGAVTFIWYALTTVVRGRFATPTVGREAMLGQRCLAVTELNPVGVVLVNEARWRATADRGVQIAAGVPVEIVGVTGLLLEVDPVVLNPTSREGREDSR